MTKEAEMLQYAFSIDVKAIVISIVALFAVGVSIYGLIKKVQEITGIETKSMRKRRLMEENIETLRNDLEEIRKDRENLNKQLECLMDALKDVKHEILLEKIDNIRWTIIDFSNSIRNGRTYDLEAYNHIIEIDTNYEQILEKNGMENGRVTMAMGLIKERYEKGLRDGFPV